jgi:ribosomal subunit interface protein
MKIIIQSPHFTVKDTLDSFIRRKFSKLPHLYSKVEASEICLKLEKSEDDEDKTCQVRLSLPGHDLFVSKKSSTFEESVDHCVDALTKQIESLKGRKAVI